MYLNMCIVLSVSQVHSLVQPNKSVHPCTHKEVDYTPAHANNYSLVHPNRELHHCTPKQRTTSLYTQTKNHTPLYSQRTTPLYTQTKNYTLVHLNKELHLYI